MEFTREAEQSIDHWLANDRTHDVGAHKYHLQDFGLSLEDLRNRFKDYRARYNVPLEKA